MSQLTLKTGTGNINLSKEVFAGLTVAMTMIPESLSFAILAGLPPLSGLYAAFIMGVVTAIFGGRPGMVSGGAGATVIVLIALMKSHGIEYVFTAVLLAGVIQVLVGVLKWGKYVRLIPQPVMYGFVNGLAIVIFLSQLNQFKTPEGWLAGTALYTMLGLVLLTVLIVWLFPKITKKIPSSLVAITVVFLLVLLLKTDTSKVKDIAGISGSFPPFHIPAVSFNWETLQIVLPYAAIMAAVGLLESLLTLSLVDDITNSRGNRNKECVAQGAGNILNGLFTGMGGCAMIAQTFVNLDAGARTRWSGIIGAFTILLIILVGAPLIEQVPMAALIGVMMVVAVTTFKWSSLRIIRKMPKADIFIGMLVAAITILWRDLALAVLAGVVIAALVYAWQSGHQLKVSASISEGKKHYLVKGNLFFGSVSLFLEGFEPNKEEAVIYVDFKEAVIMDMSAIQALNTLYERYSQNNLEIHYNGFTPYSMKILVKAGDVVRFPLS